MIIFFYFEKTIRVVQNEFGFTYEHKFEQVPDAQKVQKQVPFRHVYFSTPSDFHNHVENIKKQMGEEMANQIRILNPPQVIERPEFPLHIGFYKEWDKVISNCKERMKGKKKISVALLNAMSNAIGDHLIGMQAFEYFQEQLRKDLDMEVDFSFYQLNPYRVAPITRQSTGLFQHIYMLPNRLERLMEHDAFIDLGTLLLRDNFGTQPMIDFFLEALSINPATVPNDRKRMKYQLDPAALQKIQRVFNIVRSKGRPILLFHRTSTSPIRQLTEPRARQIVREIIEKTDYFVVSADHLEYQNARFMDMSRYSASLDDFASIISQADALVTVDTSTYHIADAFSIPTIVLFTTIEPEYRIKYYPFTEGIMLEEKGGKMYGAHKCSKEEKTAREEFAYIEKKWDTLSVDDVIEKLEIAKKHKQEAS
jgi:ADP-heptose:LPS heptosyltransferase